MKVLVAGGTGTVGSRLVEDLGKREAEVRVWTRKLPDAADARPGVEYAAVDALNPDSVGEAMQGVDKLFLLQAVSTDELTQALIALEAAKRQSVRHITYLSVLQAERFPNVPHFAAKRAVELALADSGIAHTLLRPGYYLQNEVWVKDAIAKSGVYPMPLGTAGIAAIDAGDIAEAAAVTLTTDGHDGQSYDLVSTEPVSGPHNAEVWGRVLGREVRYGGHDFGGFEAHLRSYLPSWNSFDIRQMFQGFYERGLPVESAAVDRLTTLLGHTPKTFTAFAEETAAAWKAERTEGTR